ncbi:MAG: relaxase/mobilization nuclease [bacterium P3]|nr:MAG: relaxase/mobilization nuclease [bacterium P3]
MAVPCVIKILGATATSFAAVDYNENKVAEGVAECVAMRNFGPLEQYNFHAADTMKKYLQKIADRNDRVQHPQLHIMVSYPGIPSEEEKTILLQNFKDTLDRLGYKDQPQAIWAHNDTDHFHFHAATVRVDQKTGRWINNSWEGVKARRILDQLRGIEHDRQLDKMLDYNYTSLNQFQHILRANGYHFHVDEENNNLEVYRACKNVGTVNIDEIKAKAEENMAKRKTDKEEQLKRLKQVRAVISKYRDKSLSAIVDIPETVKTKSGKVHTKTATKGKVKRAKFQGSNGLDLTELKKAQFKQFLINLKRTAGLEILFHKGEDGKVKGYSIIDNSKGIIYNGSDVMKLSALLNGKGMTEEIIPADLAEEVNQEYRDERTAKRDNITPSNIYEIVLEKLKEFNLSWREPSFLSAEVMPLSVDENCQKAIDFISQAETQHANGNWHWEMNAEKAAMHAHAAFVMAKNEKASKVEQTQEKEHVRPVQQQQPKRPVKPIQPKPVSVKPWTIPFINVSASVKVVDNKPTLFTTIDERERSKVIHTGHYAWYQQQPNKQKAALELAMHYYGNSIFAKQKKNYEKAFMDRGRMPYDIEVTKAHPYSAGNIHDAYHCSHQFHNPDTDNTWSTAYDTISKQDYIDYINGKKSATQIAIDNFGEKLLREIGNPTAEEVMKEMGMTADFTSDKGLKESVDFENKISLEMMQTFGGAFGAAALEVVLGGTHNVVGMGGGGGDNSQNRRGDDRDETTYQGMKPSKKKGQVI